MIATLHYFNKDGTVGIIKGDGNNFESQILPFSINQVYSSFICYSGTSVIYDCGDKLMGFGTNFLGELGLGENVKVTDNAFFDIITNGGVQYIKADIKTTDISKLLVNIPIDYNSIKRIIRPKGGNIDYNIIRTSEKDFVDGFYGTIFIMKDGTVKGCGANLYGYNTIQYDIVDLPLTNVDNIFYSNGSWFIIFNDGNFKACGNNLCGSLGVGKDDINVLELTDVQITKDGLVDIKCFNSNNNTWRTTIFLYDNGNVCFSGFNAWLYIPSIKSYPLMYGSQIPLNKTNIPLKSYLTNIKQIDVHLSTENGTNFEELMILSNEGYMIYSSNVNGTFSGTGTTKDNLYCNTRTDIKEFYTFYTLCPMTVNSDSMQVNVGSNTMSAYYQIAESGFIQSTYLYKDNTFDYYSFNDYFSYNVNYNKKYRYYNVDSFTNNITSITENKNDITDNNNNKNKISCEKAELMKNYSESLGEIDLKWIDKITYNYNTEITNFKLTIPKYIGGEKQINPIFETINSNQKVKVTRKDGVKDIYILKEQVIYEEKDKGNKTYTAYSLEKVLENIKINITEGYYNLYDFTENSILGLIEKHTQWSIGYIDERAKTETLTTENETTVQLLVSPIYSSEHPIFIEDGSPIFKTSSDFNIGTIDNTIGKEPLYLTITYPNVIGDTDANNVSRIYGGQIIHTFDEPFYDNIIKIEINYYNRVGNRYSLQYIFTMLDGTQKTVIKPFINLTNILWNRVTFSPSNEISITYNTGEKVRKSSELYLYFDAIDDSAMKVLSDISDIFNVAFQFDTMNKIINVYSLNSLGDTIDDVSSNLGSFILGKSKLGTNSYDTVESANLMLSFNDVVSVTKTDTDSDIINGLKVVGKNNLSIINVNPNGTDTIENWDYYINNGLLTDSCISALSLYNETLKNKQTQWETMQTQYLDSNSTLTNYQSQIQSYQEQLTGLQYLLTGYKNSGDTTNATTTQSKINDYTSKLNTANTDMLSLQDNISELSSNMSNYADSISKENIVDTNGNKIFSFDDLQLLSDLTSVQTVNDDYFSDELALYEHYVDVMKDKVKPKVQLTTKTGNMYKYLFYNNKILNLGSWYDLDNKLQSVFNEKRVRLISFDYYPNKGKYGSFENLTFSNKITKINKFRKALDVSSTVSKTAQTVSSLSSSVSSSSTDISNKLDITTFSQYGNAIQQQIDNINGGIQIQSKGNSTITLNANESSKSVDIVTFTSGTFTLPPIANIYCEVGSSRVPLPYMRFDTNYTFDISTPFNLIITASITKDKITINCKRSQDTSTTSESFTIDYVVFKE